MNFLKSFGHFLMKVIHVGEEAAVIAAPFVNQYVSKDVAALFNSSLGFAYAAEATAAGVTGTGAQKLAQVVTNVNPLIDQFVSSNNLGTFAAADRQKFVSALVDALNLLPGPAPSTGVPVYPVVKP